MKLLMYLAAFLSGICASLGIGGGLILAVCLTVFFGMSQIEAQGINLLFFLPIALLSIILHAKKKLIEKKKAIVLIIAGSVGTVCGALLAHYIKGEILQNCFAAFLLLTGIREIICAFKKKKS